jgi:REP-associated tyrosine transposase
MTRPKRINLPWCLYHVLSRTNSGDLAFYDDKDINKFLGYLAKYADLFSFRIHAWCIMPNHFHLLVESRERPGLSELMRRLLTAYTVYFNRRYRRHGHLFQGRFKSLVVEKSGYLLALSRYIHLNPAKMKPPADPVKFSGSSMKYYAKGSEPIFLTTKEILSWFNGDREQYIKFVNEGLNEDTTPKTLKQRYIGNEAFARRLDLRMNNAGKKNATSSLAEMKTNQFTEQMDLINSEIIEKAVSKYYNISGSAIRSRNRAKGNCGKAKSLLTFLIYENIPWSLKQIAKFMNFKYVSSVSHHTNKVNENKNVQKDLQIIRKVLTLVSGNFTPLQN